MVDHETDEVWRSFRAGHIVAHGQILELPDGDLLAPVYGIFPGDAAHSASVVRSTDGGRTWPAAGEVLLGRKADTEYLARELAALRLAVGEVATRDYLRGELDRLRKDLRKDAARWPES